MLFVASDSDDAGPAAKLPHGLDFLRKECSCQLRVCFQQFKNLAEQVQRKRHAFRLLPPNEKDSLDKLFETFFKRLILFLA